MIENVIEFRKPTTLDEILNYTREHLEDFHRAQDYYYVYCKEDKLDIKLTYYLDDGPEITDDDEEIYSDFVIENNLEYVARSENISDVIALAVQQKKNVTNEEIVEAINYYLDHDDFMDF